MRDPWSITQARFSLPTTIHFFAVAVSAPRAHALLAAEVGTSLTTVLMSVADSTIEATAYKVPAGATLVSITRSIETDAAGAGREKSAAVLSSLACATDHPSGARRASMVPV
ncbi:hypothetical protein FQZ97_1135430 [compost metagenome]